MSSLSRSYPHPSFDCGEQIAEALINQTLDRAIGSSYVYSDLSFITLMYVVGQVVMVHGLVSPQDLSSSCASYQATGVRRQCYFEAFVRTRIFAPLGMTESGYLPAFDRWGDCAPAENGTTVHPLCFQGQVSDGNAYVLGGIAGHAGVFSHVRDLSLFMHDLMFTNSLLLPSTVSLFTRQYNHSQSSRALGWNTNDPTVDDEGWNLSCGTMSSQTYMHTGYTGTMLCLDPTLKYYVALLTNRVYPTDAAGSGAIHLVRQMFTTIVRSIMTDQMI